MDPVEKAIRNALEKGNAADATFRARVYQAARAALERSANGGASLTAEQIGQRHTRLLTIISAIEAEFAPAVDVAFSPPVEVPETQRPVESLPGNPVEQAPLVTNTRRDPVIAGSDPDLSGFRRHPDFGPDSPAPTIEAERPPRGTVLPPSAGAVREPSASGRGARGIGLVRFFVAATFLAAIGVAAWWVVDTGLLKSPEERDTSVPNPPVVLDGEEFVPKDAGAPEKPGDAAAVRDWITIFTPGDPTTVQVPTGATAEIVGSGAEQAMRIRSSGSDMPVIFDVGEGILQQLAGGKAVFDIVARSEEGKPTQISVTCDFAEFGDCGRKRYEIGYERGEYLFEMTFPSGGPGAGGTIAVVSDVANGGKALEVFQIRVSATERSE